MNSSRSTWPRRRRYITASREPLPDSSASEPSGLKIRSVATYAGSSLGDEQQDAVGADAEVRVAEPPDPRRRQLPRQLARLDDQVVVAERLPFLERASRPARSLQRGRQLVGRAPAGVERARRRPACASRSAGAWRSCGCGASSPRRRRSAAPRSRAPRAAVLEAPRAVRGADLLDHAGGDHRIDAPVDARVERVALHHEADEARRVAHLARSTAATRPRGGSSAPISSSSSARTIRWRSAGSIVAAAHGARCASSACRACGPLRSSSWFQRSRTPGGGGGRSDELGQRGAQVEAGAADDDRRRAVGEQRVDLGVRELGVLGDAEARVERRRTRPAGARARAAAAARRDAGQDLEAGVDLQRVGGDRDRPLAARAQPRARARARRRSCRPRSARTARSPRRSPAQYRERHGHPHRRGLSRSHDARTAAIDASQEAAVGARAASRSDVAVVFACGDHLEAPGGAPGGRPRGAAPARSWSAAAPAACSPPAPRSSRARRSRSGPRRSTEGAVRTFHASSLQAQKGDLRAGHGRARRACPTSREATGVIVLPDPYSFDTDALLVALREHATPRCRCSAASRARAPADGSAALFHGELVRRGGRGRAGLRGRAAARRASRRARRRSGPS